jgi:multidrug transporter EmrE-like cation transporter
VFIAAVAGYFFFKEKLTVTNRFGIVLAVLAIALIALS